MKKHLVFALLVLCSFNIFGMKPNALSKIAIGPQNQSLLFSTQKELLGDIFLNFISTDKHGNKLDKGEVYQRIFILSLVCKKAKSLLSDEKIKQLLLNRQWHKTYGHFQDTAIHREIFLSRNLGTIKALVKHGAHYTEANKENLLPLDVAHQKLFFARSQKERQTLKDIISFLSSLDKTVLCTHIWLYNSYLKFKKRFNFHGDTLLHIAAMTGNIDLIDHCLFQAIRININFENHYGKTALYYAAENGHLDAVIHLLNYGAIPIIRGGRNYETPGERAQARGHTTIANLLFKEENGWRIVYYNGRPFYSRILHSYNGQ